MSFLSATLLSQTIDDHIEWMTSWSRIALCLNENRAAQSDALLPPESFNLWRREAAKDLQDQPVLTKLVALWEHMHRAAKLTILKAPEGAPIFLSDFDSVASKYQELMSGMRRFERAMAAAEGRLDTLTGLHSRAGMRDDLARELNRFQRNNKPFCLALLDIDHFKKVNDTYGHESGDKVLASVANQISRNLRSFDDAWRWGGEEFLICMKEADLIVGLMVAERIRVSLEKTKIQLNDGRFLSVTASFGVVVAIKEATIDGLLETADKALYKAKGGGRNKVETLKTN